MRFYSEIRVEPQKYLDEICEKPYLVFAKDFLYYVAALHDVDWRPNRARPAYNSYQPHPLSPCTKNVKKAMEQILGKSLLSYELLYEELIPNEAENKLELFINRASKTLGKLTDNPLYAFFALLHLGRWTVSFYKHGTKDAADLVPHLIAEVLEKKVGNSIIWFFNFDAIAQDLAELLKKGVTKGFFEECQHYFEDLDDDDDDDDESDFNEDEDDFDECNTCICGQCDDLFEYSEDEEYDDCYCPDEEFCDIDIYENSSIESEESLELIEEEDNEEI